MWSWFKKLFSKNKYHYKYPKVDVAATVLIRTLDPDGDIMYLVGKRSADSDAFPNAYCLPGGFITLGETVDWTACREVYEETSLIIYPEQLTLLDVHSDPKTDPRGQVVNVVYIIDLEHVPSVEGSDDLQSADWIHKDDAASLEFAFNHYDFIQKSFFVPFEPKEL